MEETPGQGDVFRTGLETGGSLLAGAHAGASRHDGSPKVNSERGEVDRVLAVAHIHAVERDGARSGRWARRDGLRSP